MNSNFHLKKENKMEKSSPCPFGNPSGIACQELIAMGFCQMECRNENEEIPSDDNKKSQDDSKKEKS